MTLRNVEIEYMMSLFCRTGLAFRIDEPDMLGYLLQNFYNHLDVVPFINTPVISPPFFDPESGSKILRSTLYMIKSKNEIVSYFLQHRPR